MNKLIKSIVIIFCSVSFVSHADNLSMMQHAVVSDLKSNADKSDYVGLIIKDIDDSEWQHLEKEGAEISCRVGGLAYVRVPIELINELSQNVERIYLPRRAYPTLDVARYRSNVNESHNGIEIGSDIIPYTGKGVVIGIVDGGIDPHHIAFKDKNGESKVKKYIFTQSSYETEDATFVADSYDGSEVQYAVADNECDGHGTHTTSIAAGYCPDNLYYGVALDADLVLTTMGGKLYDDEIMYGINAALDYANNHKSPVVVSLSLGSALGPHDGTGIMTDMLADELAESGQIVCFAAGNDGSANSLLSLNKNFATDDKPLSTCFARAMYGTPAQEAYMQVWSSDEKAMEICLHVIDLNTREVIYTSEYFSVNSHPEISSALVLLSSEMPNHSLLPSLDDFFDGIILVAAGVSEQNGKYMTELLAEFSNVDENSQYALGFSVKSDSGADVLLEANASTCYFRSYGVDGFVDGNSQNSISDYCTSPYVISVGAWNARNFMVDINGFEYYLNEDYYGKYDAIANYSSYGYKIDSEESLPHVAAPGTNVIAAVSSELSPYCDIAANESSGYYWGTKTGTSMACPFAAGVIALWLEAKPDLTREQILDVMKYSSATDSAVEEAGIKAGYGKINAYNGLKYIYDRYCDVNSPNLIIKPILRHLTKNEMEIVINSEIQQANISIYDVSGTLQLTQDFSGNNVIVNHNLLPGIYILTINTDKGYSTMRILIK